MYMYVCRLSGEKVRLFEKDWFRKSNNFFFLKVAALGCKAHMSKAFVKHVSMFQTVSMARKVVYIMFYK